MSRLEWLVIAAMLAIAFAVTFTHLDGTLLGRWLSGQPLPEMQQTNADDRWFYAIFPLGLLIWWSAAWFPSARDFLRTGAWVVLGVGVLMALWQFAS